MTNNRLIKFLASAAVLLAIAAIFGGVVGLVQRGDFPRWADFTALLLMFPLSFGSYQAACRTPLGRKYLYDWLSVDRGK